MARQVYYVKVMALVRKFFGKFKDTHESSDEEDSEVIIAKVTAKFNGKILTPLGTTGYFSSIFSSVLLYQIAFQTWLRDRS